MPEITLADLIEWESRLRPVHHGEATDARLEREVSWVVTVRASAPMLPPLRGGELVLLPGRVLADSGLTAPALLRELASLGAGAAALDAWPPQPTPLPCLIANPITPELESELNRLLTERRGEFYRTGTELGRLLADATAGGADLADILATAASFLDVPATVVDARGAPLAATSSDPAPVTAAHSGGRGWSGERYGVRLTGGESLWLGPVPRARRAVARLVGERIALAAEAAIARAAEARPRGPARAAAVAALLGSAPSEAPRLAAILGLPSNGVYRVALAAAEIEPAALARTLAPFGAVHEASAVDRLVAALVELRPEATAAIAGRSSARAARPAAPREATAGRGWLALSDETRGAGVIPEAARQARFVAALLANGLIAGPIARFDSLPDLGVYRLLYRLWGTPDLDRFVADALGDLAAHDRRGVLRQTLLAYLAAGGSQVDAAARLAVHRNTLAYRLKQIAAHTHHDPTDPASHLVFHLALLAAGLPAT